MRSVLSRAPTQLRPPGRSVPAIVGHRSGGDRDAPVVGGRATADRLEMEADGAADRLVQPVSSATKPGCACGGGCPSCATSVASGGALSVLGTSGQSLDPATRAFMEPRFGHDFGDVRIHTGSQAAQAAASLRARAFTLGRDIVFG